MKRIAAFLFAGLATFFLALPAQAQMQQMEQNGEQHTEAKEAAQEAAEQWLSLTDAGDFGASYDAASAMLQSNVERQQWVTQGEKVQEQNITDPQSRELAVARFRESLPQADGGPFVMLQYRTEFEPGTFNEIVLAVQEEGEWKIAGYQVRPMQRMPQNGGPQGGQGQSGQGSPQGGGR